MFSLALRVRFQKMLNREKGGAEAYKINMTRRDVRFHSWIPKPSLHMQAGQQEIGERAGSSVMRSAPKSIQGALDCIHREHRSL